MVWLFVDFTIIKHILSAFVHIKQRTCKKKTGSFLPPNIQDQGPGLQQAPLHTEPQYLLSTEYC